jgi:hypothetical protein
LRRLFFVQEPKRGVQKTKNTLKLFEIPETGLKTDFFSVWARRKSMSRGEMEMMPIHEKFP